MRQEIILQFNQRHINTLLIGSVYQIINVINLKNIEK